MATASVPSVPSTLSKVSILKEGPLLKRQRGQSYQADMRKLKFQQRYISLIQDRLYYYRSIDPGQRVNSLRDIEIKLADLAITGLFVVHSGIERREKRRVSSSSDENHRKGS